MPSQRPNKSKLKTITSLIISLLFVAYIYHNWPSIQASLASAKFQYFGLALLGQFGIVVSNTGLLKASLRPFGKSLKGLEAFQITAISSFVNFFAPVVGGASTRAVYLKQKHNLAYASFISVLYANYLIGFLVSFIVGLVGTVLAQANNSTQAGNVLLLFFGSGIITMLVIFVSGHKLIHFLSKSKPRNKLIIKILNTVTLIDAGWRVIRKDVKTVALMVVWCVSVMLSLLLVYWATMSTIGLHGNPGTIMIFAALASISLLFNLTPGNVGVKEAIYASIFVVTAVNANQVVAFSLVDRAAQLVILGASWLLFGNRLIKSIGKLKTE